MPGLPDTPGEQVLKGLTAQEAWDAAMRDPNLYRARTARDEEARRALKDTLIQLRADDTAPPLWRALPPRNLDEPLLAWITRCQVAAVDAAVSMAATADPALEVQPSPRGWYVRHRGTGQRIEVFTRLTPAGPLVERGGNGPEPPSD